jgi:hypothetical protein
LSSNSAGKPAAYEIEAAEMSVDRPAQAHEKYERLIAQAKGIPAIATPRTRWGQMPLIVTLEDADGSVIATGRKE